MVVSKTEVEVVVLVALEIGIEVEVAVDLDLEEVDLEIGTSLEMKWKILKIRIHLPMSTILSLKTMLRVQNKVQERNLKRLSLGLSPLRRLQKVLN